MKKIRTQEIIKIIRLNSKFTYWFGVVFFFRTKRAILFSLYSYFRWLDDILDNVTTTSEFSEYIIKRQLELVSSLFHGGKIVANYTEENYISDVILSDIKYDYHLKEIIDGFFYTLSWDVKRKHSVPTKKELDIYSYYLGQSYSQGMVFGIGFSPFDQRFIEIGEYCGVAAHITHMLRDFFIDLDLGYINISQEDMKKYNILLSTNRQILMEELTPWYKDKISEANHLFKKGMKLIPTLPSIRAKMVFFAMSLRYLIILQKIKMRIGSTNTTNG